MVLVLTLLCHGCPTQAIVAAFGLDERTVARWFLEAGRHCQRVHEHLVEQGQVDLQHVQADELWVKQVGGKVWMALALAVPSRLWLGGVISRHRDLPLITRLVERVLACAATRAILVCVDGLASYVTAFPQVFRQPIRTGRRGRPRLVLPDGLPARPGREALRQAPRRRRHPPGRPRHPGRHRGGADGDQAPARSSTPPTSSASTPPSAPTSRPSPAAAAPSLAPRRPSLPACGWSAPPTTSAGPTTASAGSPLPTRHGQWHERTPAMAAGLADHPWTIGELLRFQIPLPRWVPPKRRGRPPKHPPLKAAA